MLARWDLTTAEFDTEITYQNLITQEILECGKSDMRTSELLDWMLNEGGGGPEVVFIDGVYALHLLAPSSDFNPQESLDLGSVVYSLVEGSA